MAGSSILSNRRMRRLLLLSLFVFSLGAQPEDWTGRRVRVLLAMPADDSGIDVPGKAGEAAERVKKYGIGLREGQTAAITLVKRSGGHVEIHLNGGGFTNREWLQLPSYDSPRWGSSPKEDRLRDSIRGTRDKDRRRQLESDYDWERRKRVKPMREKLERERRAERGSRLNVRMGEGATASEWQAAIAPYFSWLP